MNLDIKSTWRPAPPIAARLDCGTCHGTGWELLPGPGAGFARRCACRVHFNSDRMEEQVGIPQRYAHCTLESFAPQNFSQVRGLAEARRFAERYPAVERGLLFVGTPGIGKTHLAVGIATELLQRFQDDILFVDFPSLVGPFTGRAARFDWGRLRRVSLLLLDNFGVTAPDDEGLAITEELLRGRSESRKTTVFTGERLQSRELFGGPAGAGLSRTHNYMHALSRSLVVRLLSETRVLSMVGDDYRNKAVRQ